MCLVGVLVPGQVGSWFSLWLGGGFPIKQEGYAKRSCGNLKLGGMGRAPAWCRSYTVLLPCVLNVGWVGLSDVYVWLVRLLT
jgi:hypothetical protein